MLVCWLVGTNKRTVSRKYKFYFLCQQIDYRCYDDVLRAILLRKISEFPSGTRTHKIDYQKSIKKKMIIVNDDTKTDN